MTKRMKNLTTGKFHNFKKEALFTGIYTGKTRLAEETDQYAQKGDVTAFEFLVDGVPIFVPAKTVIANTLLDEQIGVKEGDEIRIEYLGSKKSSTGNKYDNFDLKLLYDDELEEMEFGEEEEEEEAEKRRRNKDEEIF